MKRPLARDVTSEDSDARHVDIETCFLSTMSVPPELKSIQSFIQRAEEVKTTDPVIAYWCTSLVFPHRLLTPMDPG